MENEKKKGRGRPKGRGAKVISLAELSVLLGDQDAMVPVPFNWLKAQGTNPDEYEFWNSKAVPVAKTVEPDRVEPDRVEPDQVQEEEEEQIEFTITR